jgi:hypothetical protein
MLEHDYIDYTLKEVKKCKNKPYIMCNKELASEIFPVIKKVYPDAEIYTLGITQYIIVSDKAKKVLYRKLNKKKADYQSVISEIDIIINSLN